MATAYTPGLKVSPHIRHRCKRILPIQGEVLVKEGEKVSARDIVAQTFMPGDITPLNLANLLSLPPADVSECLLKSEGEAIAVGDVLARTKGIFGFFKSEYKAKVAGTIESISKVTGQVIVRGEPLPVQVSAYMSGVVTKVIPNSGIELEADVAYIQGIFGIGGETHGELQLACENPTQDLTKDLLTPEMKGKILVGGARMTGDAVRKGIELGVSAIISGGFDDQDLKEILGYDLGVAITGSEKVGTTLIITEGFGQIAMAQRTFDLLSEHVGQEVSVNGATQIRAGVMRPEIIIPLNDDAISQQPVEKDSVGELTIGREVRIIRDPWFGKLGVVHSLPTEPQTLDSGSRSRVLEVKLTTDEVVTIPRANVEITGV